MSNSIFSVCCIDHLVLRVADLDRSIAFYREVLGCAVERERRELGLVHLRAGASLIDLVAVDGKLGRAGGAAPDMQRRNLDHLCLRIEPFDETKLIDHLAAHGVEPLGPVVVNFGAQGDGPALYLHDPDRNTIELKGPTTDR